MWLHVARIESTLHHLSFLRVLKRRPCEKKVSDPHGIFRCGELAASSPVLCRCLLDHAFFRCFLGANARILTHGTKHLIRLASPVALRIRVRERVRINSYIQVLVDFILRGNPSLVSVIFRRTVFSCCGLYIIWETRKSNLDIDLLVVDFREQKHWDHL